jgi:phosphoglycerate dehydrogenase-like enzyme
VPNDVFVGARRLRYYHSIGAGVDAILTPELVTSDVILASEKGEVGIHLAEHAFALLLGLTRGLHTAIRKPDFGLREPIRKEQWELYDRPLGFGMKVFGVDIDDVPGMAGVTLWKGDRLHDLLGAVDVVVICLPLTKATRHLFTRDLFRRMRRHAILINVTRATSSSARTWSPLSTRASSAVPASTSPTPSPYRPVTASGRTPRRS